MNDIHEHVWEEGQFPCNLGTADYRCKTCGALSWKDNMQWGEHEVLMPIEHQITCPGEPLKDLSRSTVAMSDDEMRVQWKRVTERRNAAEAALRVANEESDRWYQQMMQRGLIP